MTDTGLTTPAEPGAVDEIPDVPRRDWTRRRERWPDPAAILRELGVGAGTSVVEVGVGAGYFALPAAAIVDPAPVYVILRDGTLLDELCAAALEADLDNLVTISGRAGELSALLPARVDAVLLVDSLGPVETPTAFAEQVARSLEPGGRFIVVERRDEAPAAEDSPSSADRLPPERVRSVVAPAGFEVDREVDVRPDHYALVLKRGHDA